MVSISAKNQKIEELEMLRVELLMMRDQFNLDLEPLMPFKAQADEVANCIDQRDFVEIVAFAIYPQPDDNVLKAVATILKDPASRDW